MIMGVIATCLFAFLFLTDRQTRGLDVFYVAATLAFYAIGRVLL